jgi:hypothetical protein
MGLIPKTEPPARIAGLEPDPYRVAPQPSPVALGSALDRIEEVLRAEEKALAQAGDVDLEDINRRKNHSLLELTRISRTLPRDGIAPEMLTRIEAIRDKLLRSQDILQVHLAAAQEISRVLTDALGEAESDGTYSRVVQGLQKGDRP